LCEGNCLVVSEQKAVELVGGKFKFWNLWKGKFSPGLSSFESQLRKLVDFTREKSKYTVKHVHVSE
jgi:hypothetical protein